MKRTIIIEDIEIRFLKEGTSDYISLTDLAKKKGEPKTLIQNWMRNRDTVEFLGVWESLNNPKFNSIEFDAFLYEAGSNTFSLSPKKWIEATNSTGIISKSGRYGGTYAHQDIAIGFCYWLSPPFQLYLIQEFQRLKAEENKALNWDLRRTLSKVNYLIHTDAIKNNLIPERITSSKHQGYYYASEADLLNVALFGFSARQWKAANPNKEGNMRDYATAEQLLVLANLESLNAEFIKEGLSQDERLERLNAAAIYQMQLLMNINALDKFND